MNHSGDTNKMVRECVSNEQVTGEATPNEELRQQILSPCVAKNEREWWAARTIEKLERQLNSANERIKRLEDGIAKQNQTIEQACGKVLGYPWFKDDQKNFPGATEKDGVCVGEHVAETVVCELVGKYTEALARIKRLEDWKEWALAVEREWNANAIATMLGGQPGESQRKVIQREVPKLLARIKRLEEAGDALKAAGYFGGWADAVNKWNKVKEDKP